jgi:hypothetical protein
MVLTQKKIDYMRSIYWQMANSSLGYYKERELQQNSNYASKHPNG